MTRFYRTNQLHGNCTCIEDDPSIVRLFDHIFNPDPTLGYPGIYDRGRKLVHQTAYSRGPNPADVLPPLQPTFFDDQVSTVGNEETYIYLGLIHPHYGHFLLSTFSRLWNIQKLPRYKILYVSTTPLDLTLKPYVKSLLRALEIDLSRLTTFQSPVRIKEVILPYPSFEEQNFCHRTFSTLCNMVGDRVVAEAAHRPGATTPIYLSKDRIRSGVRRIVNESEICEQLERKGFRIEYPEEMSFPDQVALWRADAPVISFAASALHTSVFAKGPELICFNYDAQINSSFTLCDWANRTNANYFHFEADAFEVLGPSDDYLAEQRGMSIELRARDPLAIADGLARATDFVGTRRRTLTNENNIALSRPTTQSSNCHEDEVSGSGATSGVITGGYQFHTAFEEAPWWQVDLGQTSVLTQVRIFNRTDAGVERSAALIVLLSIEGTDFEAVYTRTDPAPFGGLTGQPLCITFDPAKLARYVRLSIAGPGFLHLDQVEIIGQRDTINGDTSSRT